MFRWGTPTKPDSVRGGDRSIDHLVPWDRGIGWNDVDETAAKSHRTLDPSHEGVILASLDEIAGLESSSTLANDDRASLGELPAVELDATVLGV
jgi:hypothetical protein